MNKYELTHISIIFLNTLVIKVHKNQLKKHKININIKKNSENIMQISQALSIYSKGQKCY